LSREEVARLLAAVDNLKHQTALAVAYGAGLRVSEVVSLKVSDPSTGSGQASTASA
jgi:integrase